MPRRRLNIMAFAGAASVAAVLSASPAFAELRTFGNWLVGCDNRADCTAIGLPDQQGSPASQIALRIGVDSASASGFEVAMLRVQRAVAGRLPITVTCLLCNNGVRAPGDQAADQIILDGRRFVLPGMQGAQWLDALGKGRAIVANAAGDASGARIDTARFLDAWKHLAQTRGDLMRQLLASANPPVPGETAIQGKRQRAFPATEVMAPDRPAFNRLTRQCPARATVADRRQFLLPGNVALWGIACRKAGTRTWHWFLDRGAADLPAPLTLPDGDQPDVKAGEVGFEDSVFDFDFGILRGRSGPALREDCGIQRAWGWDGQAWFLLERREMPACIGLEPLNWVRTYIAP
ncbi:MAG: DUF1176 domain-containing protein [Beijerinckiaceae bacterium]|jgi:hypothetical protein|nr:DUF1176 domain-containing protein [Beijerinckiaceae bacterium]